MENNPNAPFLSNTKRNPGFAPIRRGLLEHLGGMSGNAVKAYVWLHLKVTYRPGPKRGWVAVSFDDMAQELLWSQKTLQRAIGELETKPFIEVRRAANQYELTRVRILKYDPEECTSAVDKSDQSNEVAMDTAVDVGVDKFDHCAVHSNSASVQSQKNLRAPKKVEEVKKESKHQAAARVTAIGYDEARIRFREVTRRSLGSLGVFQDQWVALVEEYGVEWIVGAVELFARDVKSRLDQIKYPLCIFFKDAAGWIAEAGSEPVDVPSNTEGELPRLVASGGDDDYPLLNAGDDGR